MKKIIKLLFVVLSIIALFSLIGCNKENEGEKAKELSAAYVGFDEYASGPFTFSYGFYLEIYKDNTFKLSYGFYGPATLVSEYSGTYTITTGETEDSVEFKYYPPQNTDNSLKSETEIATTGVISKDKTRISNIKFNLTETQVPTKTFVLIQIGSEMAE